jgi:hypothetical protein
MVRASASEWEGMGPGEREDMETNIRKVTTFSLVGAAVMAVGVLLVRTQKLPRPKDDLLDSMQAGETVPGTVSLERLRELGI